MRKAIVLIGLIATILGSCSKDDDNENPTVVNFVNLEGVWYFKRIVKPDGSEIPYQNLCSSGEDNIRFYSYDYVEKTNFYSDCSSYTDYSSDFYFLNGRYTGIGFPYLFDSTIILDDNTMIIEYDEVKYFDPNRGLDQVSEFILERY